MSCTSAQCGLTPLKLDRMDEPGTELPKGSRSALASSTSIERALSRLRTIRLCEPCEAAGISAMPSARLLDLVWASLLGWIVFADVPTQSTPIGGSLICAATLWVARRESRGTAVTPSTPP
jgi:hypothetical protein